MLSEGDTCRSNVITSFTDSGKQLYIPRKERSCVLSS